MSTNMSKTTTLPNMKEITEKIQAIQLPKEKINQNCESLNKTNAVAPVVVQNNVEAESGASQEPEESIPLQERSLLQKIVRTKLVDSKYDIEIQRKDPKSPLYSVKSFEALDLKPELLKGVYNMGFNAPSKIQETAVPTLLADPPQNMIAQSQSGTGKTAAYVLAMLSRVKRECQYTQALCVCPTYELAVQVGEVVAKMAVFCPEIIIKFALRGEGKPTGREHVIIGTPGKLVDWSVKYKYIDLSKLTVFILDEADVMIATQGHREQSLRIRKFLSKSCQMMLFSATYDTEVMQFAEMMVPNAVIIKLRREEESLDNIEQYYVQCDDLNSKYKAMANVYGICTVGQMIIFCQTKKIAIWLSETLTKDGHAVAILIGDLTIEQRIQILDRFRDGKHRVLITTNVLARGIDIDQVTMVVNWDLPVDRMGRPDYETYLHRIGRTGRFGKTGMAINLIDSMDKFNIMKGIEKHFGITIERLDTDSDDLEKLEES